MYQGRISINLEENTINEFNDFCIAKGINMTTAISLFIKKTLKEKKIPFEVSEEVSDPFYSIENMELIKNELDRYRSGKAEGILKTMEELKAME